MSLRTIVGAILIALVVNTAYVWAFASPTVFYMANVLGHLGLGLLVVILGAALLARDGELRRRPFVLGASAAMGIAAACAVYLVIFGNVSDHRPVRLAHVISGCVSVGGLTIYLWTVRAERTRAFAWAFAAAAVLLAALPAGVRAYTTAHPAAVDRITNPGVVPVSMDQEGGGRATPFFPSSAQTNVGGTIPSDFFTESETCGECHQDIYAQWKSSMHHFASFNNQFYRKSIEYMQAVVGTQPSKWCAGCHDHAVFFNGRFERPIKEQIDTVEARAGLACTSCHSIVRVGSTMGNGDFTIAYPPLHRLASSRNRYIKAMDRFLTYLDPEPHRRSFMKPFMRQDSAEFCAACHKVHLDAPVNEYRWFRGFNEYDNWQASGVSGQGARSFYYPQRTQTCVDCHMPQVRSADPGHHADGTVHSHRFAAANTAVPFINHDATQLADTEAFLKSGFIGVDIFAAAPIDESREGTRMLRRAGDALQPMTSFAVGEEAEQAAPVTIRDVGQLAAPLDRAQPRLVPGSTARVDVVVRTKTIGHFFPAGTVDAFDVWLELQGRDATGRVIFWSGGLANGATGPVDEGAHFYRSYQLDGHGNPINKRNAWQSRTTLYVRLIPPGAADVAHYRVKIPSDAQGPITFTAKLNYRKFSYYYTQFAFAGEPAPGPPGLLSHAFDDRTWTFDPANIPKNVSSVIKDRIPDLPVVTMAEATATLPLGASGSQTAWTPVVDKADRGRWNDWGIGLLLQGDLKGAEYAFRQVTAADPGYADGWLNAARALIQEGETEAAKPFVAQALAIDASLGRIYFFKAMIEKADGDYAAALKSLDVAMSKYPRDRVVLNQIARILFLDRRYAEALTALDRVRAIDPEDLQMHYTAMLCYRALGREADASRQEALFRRFKAEEASQSITASRRRISPEDNNERQPIHEHESAELGTRD